MKICLVIPTYNEKKNISKLIPKILKTFKDINEHNMNLLIVDDNSPDGTADIVKSFSSKNKNIFLLNREKKRGLWCCLSCGL